MSPGPGFLPTFLYYFVCTSVITVLVISQQGGISLSDGALYRASSLMGLGLGLIGAYFNRSKLISISFQDKKIFQARLNQVLAELGYEEKSQMEEFTVYERPNFQGVLSGKIFVQIEQDSASIAGRASKVATLGRKLAGPTQSVADPKETP